MARLDQLDKLLELTQNNNVDLVAISKTKPDKEILEIYDHGHKIFGENRAPELLEKSARLPKDISWHMVGHLQRNKVKKLVDIVALIHSVDSLRLLQEINKQAEVSNKNVSCLLQINIAEEQAKFGFNPDELVALLDTGELDMLTSISIQGLMGMATFTNDMTVIRNEFRGLKSFFDSLKGKYFSGNSYFRTLSMGMTNDYEVAIEEGSTMIRVGSLIFGARK